MFPTNVLVALFAIAPPTASTISIVSLFCSSETIVIAMLLVAELSKPNVAVILTLPVCMKVTLPLESTVAFVMSELK